MNCFDKNKCVEDELLLDAEMLLIETYVEMRKLLEETAEVSPITTEE